MDLYLILYRKGPNRSAERFTSAATQYRLWNVDADLGVRDELRNRLWEHSGSTQQQVPRALILTFPPSPTS